MAGNLMLWGYKGDWSRTRRICKGGSKSRERPGLRAPEPSPGRGEAMSSGGGDTTETSHVGRSSVHAPGGACRAAESPVAGFWEDGSYIVETGDTREKPVS